MNSTQSLIKTEKAKKFIVELQISKKSIKIYFIFNKN